MSDNPVCYAIYCDDDCNEGFYEVDRYYILDTALTHLIKFRKEHKYLDYWLVVILDE